MAKKPAAPRSTKTAAAAAGHAHAGGDMPASDGTIAPSMDYAAHEAMYHRFTGLVKWAVIVAFVAMILLFIIVRPMISVPG